MKYLPRILLLLMTFLSTFLWLSPAFATDIAVTARVGSHPSDFTLSLTSPTSQNTASQFDTLVYTITYGSLLPYQTPLTITASWSDGAIDGSSYPTVPLLQYQSDSATTAVGDTRPIIDTTKKTITWKISSFPPNLVDQTLSFKLLVTDAYQGKDAVTAHISVALTDGSVQKTDSLNQRYVFNTQLPTPPPATPTPTPVRFIPQLLFRSVFLTIISQQRAEIVTYLTTPAVTTLRYGTSPSDMSSKLTSLQKGYRHFFGIDHLTPDTQYYFQISAANEDSHILSDIYTFKTATESSLPSIIPSSVQVTSQNVPFKLSLPQNSSLTLPISTAFVVQLQVTDPTAVQNVTLTNADESSDTIFSKTVAIQTSPGTYTAQLQTGTSGSSMVTATFQDVSGNLIQTNLFTLHTSEPMQLFSSDNQPIEGAKVSFALYDQQKKRFIPLSPGSFPIQSPLLSDSFGRVPIILPDGTYQVTITHPSYEKIVTTFTLGPGSSEGYPTITLRKAPLGLFSYLQYLWGIVMDQIRELSSAVASHLISARFYTISSLVASLLFAISLFHLLLRKHHLPFAALFSHLLYTTRRTSSTARLHGTVLNAETNESLSGVTVSLMDLSSKKVLSAFQTHANGSYSFPVSLKKRYALSLQKPGFHAIHSLSFEEVTTDPLLIGLVPTGELHQIEGSLQMILTSLLTYSFEGVLFLSLLLETLFTVTLGIEKVLPFLCVSILAFCFSVLSKQHSSQ